MPRPQKRQLSATRLMEILGMGLVDFRGKHALATVEYFSGFLTYDTLESETTGTVTGSLDCLRRSFLTTAHALDLTTSDAFVTSLDT